jgi:hypothetical protein
MEEPMFITRFPATALLTAAWLLAIGAPAAIADDTHHPDAGAQATPQAAPAPAPQRGSGMSGQGMMEQGMMGMGGQAAGAGSGMMGPGMMGMMMQMQGGMMGPMPGMTEHVEGRIAFLRTELKIADNQQQAWNGFADAMRANAKRLGELRGGGMTGGPTSLQQRFEQQEKLLTAQIEGLRGLKTAYDRLAGALTADQKKLAEQLIPPHVGMMPRMMM